ncbi:16S rRNA (cytidine(1402)-2'-O)-methyltransferase [Parasulfitobacter algicola]|uniref:Ribosomal RNA small subunit methyltransferase I n=1 Tax=Parasulfitobacter algicola TaxID=2614809 RepID=A0ABX2IVP7_9RHOB|nr:16S rRNA (cytidine(1402)-2'-O)-methyltransferase [Sulfitobacter algicola]NSX54268.1 16S rRNA (cytidine(1402)-2'-O)-methyltransferase [Sulfitobacter algicola]
MNHEIKPLSAGLYFVATPIGTARDITLRALDVLASANVIAAEDTRNTRRLMEIHGIPLGDRPVISYHDHNGARIRPRLLADMAAGKSVAYASDAGTPLVADPGFALARAAVEAGHMVTSAPGPSALLAGLTLAGLPTDRFLFAGFAPNTKIARRTFLRNLADIPATLVFFESPKRIQGFLTDCGHELGGDRTMALCRELTKKFEEVRRGTISQVLSGIQEKPVKGEIVVVIDRAAAKEVNDDMIRQALTKALQTNRLKDAASQVSTDLGVARRTVYQIGLDMAKKE